MNAFGSTVGAMVQYAAMACATGMTKAVACVFADNPIASPDKSAGSVYGLAAPRTTGLKSLNLANGIGAHQFYAMGARQHMELYGTTSEQLGAIAVAQRKWALMNPRAQMSKPITLEDHQASRMISDPLRLLDCCLVSNGGVAVIVTSAELARTLKQPPVYIWGWGQGHPGPRKDKLVRTGAAISSQEAYRMAGITPAEVDICELYDCYTYTALVTIEDYGFCSKGEGGPFVEDGKTGPGGSLPVNTGGGQLSSFYMWGMTPLSEAVIQARGQGGERQVPKHDIILSSGNGGALDYHSTLVLSPLPNVR
jgi:acetyl-CoA acetyltransferase